ncbi:MAG: hypothetical protein M3145_00485 [Pseudomonadota bacterium]|nr:hypothetical protein [Pseudomonadota bacterium]
MQGLDTAIRYDMAEYLVRKAKETGLPPGQWNEAVAPYCHHYKPATDRIVLQYPPGTGFVLSFFPDGFQGRATVMSCATIVFAIASLIVLAARTPSVPVLGAALGAIGMYLMFKDSRGSLSVAPIMVACILLGWLTWKMFSAPTLGRRLLFVAATGLALGLSVSIRIPNGLLLVGFLVVLGAAFLCKPSRETFAQPAVLVTAFLVGLVPVLAANWINAGHPLSTTYNSHDASPPDLTARTIWSNFVFYFVETRSHALLCLAAVVFPIVLFVIRKRLDAPRVGLVLAVLVVSLLVSISYFLTHGNRTAYYLIPASLFVVSTCVFLWMHAEARRAARDDLPGLDISLRAALGVALALGAYLVVRLNPPLPIDSRFSRPEIGVAFGELAVIWTDTSGVLFHRHLKRHTGKLAFAGPELQDRLVASIARDGVPQFFVDDRDIMTNIIARHAKAGTMHPAGKAFGFDVYRFEAVPGDQ